MLWERTVMTVMSSVILQDSMNLLEVGPDSEICETSSHDGNEILSMKVEEVPDTQEEDPLLITFPVVKDEREVSHVCEHFHRLRISSCLLSSPLVCHIQLFYSDEWIFKNSIAKA
jgi:hypothetical protein